MMKSIWSDPCARLFAHGNNNGIIINTRVFVIENNHILLSKRQFAQSFANESSLYFPLAPPERINISGVVL